MPHKRAKQSIRVKTRKEQGSELAPTAKDSIANEGIPKSAQRILNGFQIREDYKKRKMQGDGEEAKEGGKRRKTESAAEQLKILPGESIQHFNRRVEDDLRPLVKTAMESGRAVVRKVIRDEIEAKQAAKDKKGKGKATAAESSSEPIAKSKSKSSKTAETDADVVPSKKSKKSTSAAATTPTPAASKHDGRPKDFVAASTSAPKRLNDIAMAPPELKKLSAKGGASTSFKLGKVTEAASAKSDVVSMAQKALMEQERENAIRRYREMKVAKNTNTNTKGAND
ncbi:hypothetical protein DFP72DRAFT_819057 [Ephemerocybe angulata]|uniref:Uncharacterized protein n=1 Tax=Ephemerocybe angulata TaxID=980116 RepID=A0A8H6HLW5_9AGAR|nr:hypothetical protein DFP72DRAFT_819057 [Tulosesus angulatus]